MDSVELIVKILITIAYFAVPIVLAIAFAHAWRAYARKKFFEQNEKGLLQIIPPKDILRGPLAMELVFISLFFTNQETTWIDRWYLGKTRAFHSFEIVSKGGRVMFFLHIRKSLFEFAKSQFYTQFPGIEISEVEDYATDFPYEKGEYDIFALHHKLTKPDPYPIKTYVDYGLDKEVDAEKSVDPIIPFIDFLSSLPEGHEIWFQIIFRAHKGEKKDPTKFFDFGKHSYDSWQDEARKEVQAIKKKIKEGGLATDEGGGNVIPTEMEKQVITALERSVSKHGFDVGIRSIYAAKKELFNGINIGGMIGAFKQFNSNNLNGFKPGDVTDTDYPWEKYLGNNVEKMKDTMIDAYRARGFFYEPWVSSFRGASLRQPFSRLDNGLKPMVLNSEELATIFHFPVAIIESPSYSKISARRAEPPSNLPT